MTVEELRQQVKFVNDFNEHIRERAEKLYRAKYPDCKDRLDFSCIRWFDSDEKEICVRYYDYDDSVSVWYPIEYLADDFDVDALVELKTKEYEAKKKLELEKKKLAEENAERRQYERLKAKFEGSSR